MDLALTLMSSTIFSQTDFDLRFAFAPDHRIKPAAGAGSVIAHLASLNRDGPEPTSV